MYSKRLRLLVQIIGFLFCTIGLLFICMKILNMGTEGFQNAFDIIPQCVTMSTRDKIFYKCETDNDAQMKVRYLMSTNDVFSGVCYKTDAGFYTCYTRPSQKTFQEEEGIFITDDPTSDSMPAVIESDVLTVCGDFGITYNKLNTIYVSTVSIGGVIHSSIKIVRDATASLANISTLYCNNPNAQTNACNTLSSGIGIFDGIPSGPKGLNYMSNTVGQAVSNMNNISTTLYTAYNGFGYSTCSVAGFPGYVF